MVAVAGRDWQAPGDPPRVRSRPMPDVPDWIARYTATRLGFPSWADEQPDRLALVTNRGGAWQAWAHDLTAGTWRQVSDDPVGVEEVRVLPDGRIAWFHDDTGEETGRWMAEPFEGGGVEAVFPGLPTGWSMGMAMATMGRTAVGLEVDGTYHVWSLEPDGGARELASSAGPMGVGGGWPPGDGGISPDGALVVIWHTEHGDILHPALRILDAATGSSVGEIDDGRRRLDAGHWSPDGARLAFTSERGDRARPGIWERGDGTRRDLEVDLPGDVYPVAWYPDGAMLVRHEFEARAQLFRADPDGSVTPVTDEHGDIDDAALRPDGQVWLAATDGIHPPTVVDATGRVVLESPDPPPPDGVALRDVWVENAHGDRIQALVLIPESEGPHPLVLSVHGGPEWHERHRWDPEALAFHDAGYAVALVNYRGSTGYGVRFRDALIGNVCHCESEDLIAVLDALVADGTADRERVYWSGWSWGGCLACFNAGVHPDRWRAIFAGIPGGDFVAAHRACAPELQAWDRAVYGGGPDDVPEAYARSNPMTYVDEVTAPTIIIAGEHDPRCPIEGVLPWVDAVRANGTEVEVHTYGAGHHANGMDQQVAHMRLVLDFFARH